MKKLDRRRVIGGIVLAVIIVSFFGIRLTVSHMSQRGGVALSAGYPPAQREITDVGHTVGNVPPAAHSAPETPRALPNPPIGAVRQLPEILIPTHVRNINHRALTETRQAIRDYQRLVASNQVPADSAEIFQQWARTLSRDVMMQCAVNPSLPETQRQEWAGRMVSGTVIANVAALVESSLEPAYLERFDALLARLLTLNTQEVDRATALGVAEEFARLTKDRQWESEVYYLSEYKALTKDKTLTVAEKVEASMPFVQMNDPHLTKSILAYFEELPLHERVTEGELKMIEEFSDTAGKQGQP